MYTGLLVLWLWVGAWYNWWRDIAIAALVFLVVERFHKRVIDWAARFLDNAELSFKGRFAEDPKVSPVVGEARWARSVFGSAALCRCYAILMWFLLSWIIASGANVLLGPHWLTPGGPLEANPDRFAALGGAAERVPAPRAGQLSNLRLRCVSA